MKQETAIHFLATSRTHITKWLLEQGSGYAYIGKKVPINVGGVDFIIDMLFFHMQLRCYVVIELKSSRFLPDYTGKLGFYLSAIDSLLRHPQDNPAIGLIICKENDRIVVEYALMDANQSEEGAAYELSQRFPECYRGYLPTEEEVTKATFRPKKERQP